MKRPRPAPVDPIPPKPHDVPRWLRWFPLLVFTVALSVRLLHVLLIRRADFFDVLIGDARGYDEWARRIAGGSWMGTDVFYQAPLYPYFLAVIYTVVGHSLLFVRVCQAVLGSAACALVGLTAWRLFSPRAGLVAGLVMALYAPLIFYDGLIQKSVLDIFFTCLLLWTITSSLGRARSWIWVGLSAGGLALTRENALVFIAVIMVMAVVGAPGGKRATFAGATARVGAFVLGLAILLLPVAIRNYAVGGGFYLTTSQFGPNFYIGNNPRADGTYRALRSGRGAPEYERVDATMLAEQATGRSLTPGEVSSYWTDRALSFITSQPGAWMRLVGRKAVLVVSSAEMVDTEAQETYAEWSWPVRVLGWFGHFGLLAPLAALGAWIWWPDRRRLWPIYALTGVYVASLLLFYVFGRYRVPLVPFLVLFAAASVEALPVFLRSASAPRRAGGAILVAAMLVVCNWPLVERGMPQAVTETNIGIALRERGRVADANAHFLRAIAFNPHFSQAYINNALALKDEGKPGEAIAAFERAVAASPAYADAYAYLGRELQSQGQHERAIEQFRTYLTVSQDDTNRVPVTNAIAMSFLALGRFPEATATFQQSLAREPRDVDAHRGLGDVCFKERRFEDAAREYTAAAGLAPEDPLAAHGLGLALALQNKASEAIPWLTKAADLAPGVAAFREDVGTALASVGRLDEAIAQYRRAVELAPRSARTESLLGVALAADGKPDEAVAHFRRSLELDPGDPQTRQDLDRALRQAAAPRR